MVDHALVIRPFAPADQAAARSLILRGLAEHFGTLDATLNPDLDDIGAAYPAAGHAFVVAEVAGEAVGTGALVADAPGVGRLVRMSVAPPHRRCGVGRALVAHLVELARARGDRRVQVETNDDWHDAVRLYQSCGFVEVARAKGEIHLTLDLGSASR